MEMVRYSKKNLDRRGRGGEGKTGFEITKQFHERKLVSFNYLFPTPPQSLKICNLQVVSHKHQDIHIGNYEILLNNSTICS